MRLKANQAKPCLGLLRVWMPTPTVRHRINNFTAVVLDFNASLRPTQRNRNAHPTQRWERRKYAQRDAIDGASSKLDGVGFGRVEQFHEHAPSGGGSLGIVCYFGHNQVSTLWKLGYLQRRCQCGRRRVETSANPSGCDGPSAVFREAIDAPKQPLRFLFTPPSPAAFDCRCAIRMQGLVEFKQASPGTHGKG